jgi:S1-C subfamily serine protease
MAEAFGREETSGALVQSVQEGLPADRAGIKRGDIIVSVSDKEISSANDLRFTIASIPPGTEIGVIILRDGERREFSVVLSNLEDPFTASDETSGEDILDGVVLETLSDRFRDAWEVDESVSGVAVSQVNARSPHVKALRAGMVIIEINDEPVGSLDGVRSSLHEGVNKLWTYDRGVFSFEVIRLE